MKYIDLRNTHVENYLNSKNWTGYTVRELARAGRIGSAEECATQGMTAFCHNWFDPNDIKESVRLNIAFKKLATIAIQSIIDSSN